MRPAGPELPQDWVLLGQIVGVFGVKGWIKLESYTRPRKAIFEYNPWRLGLKNGWEKRAVVAGEARNNGLVAKLEGIEDRDAAHDLIGTEIGIPRDELPAAAKGEVYWADLIGCMVSNQAGIEFGKVTGLMETGANDVLIVKNGRERLIPFIDEVVTEIDLEQGTVRVNWDEEF